MTDHERAGVSVYPPVSDLAVHRFRCEAVAMPPGYLAIALRNGSEIQSLRRQLPGCSFAHPVSLEV